MTSFPDPVKSTALVAYTPPKFFSAKASAYVERIQNIFND